MPTRAVPLYSDYAAIPDDGSGLCDPQLTVTSKFLYATHEQETRDLARGLPRDDQGMGAP
jgi:hypothetical protein